MNENVLFECLELMLFNFKLFKLFSLKVARQIY